MHSSKQPISSRSSIKSEQTTSLAHGILSLEPSSVSFHELHTGHETVNVEIANGEKSMVASLQSLPNGPPHPRRKMAKKDQKQQVVVDGLPVELVEMILCRIPFPDVFKVRLLAKEWLYRFPASSLKSLDPLFPSLVSSVSSKWNQYCPVIRTKKNLLLCFDQTSSQWRRMPMFSNLPEEFHRSISESLDLEIPICTFAFCGPMQCFYKSHYVMVCNLITKVWRRLPELPKHPITWSISRMLDRARVVFAGYKIPYIQMLAVNSDRYKVILVYRLSLDFLRTSRISHIYDSKTGIWIEVIADQFSMKASIISSAHISGRLYCLLKPDTYNVGVTNTEDGIVLELQTYLVETDSWWKTVYLYLPWSCSFGDQIRFMCGIFKCKDKIVLAAWFRDSVPGITENRIHIYHLPSEIGLNECDFEKKLNSIKRVLVLDWPRDHESDLYEHEAMMRKLLNPGFKFVAFSADDNFIYAAIESLWHPLNEPPLLAYHLETRTWSRIPSTPPKNWGQKFLRGIAFQPGLYPLMSV